MKKILTLTLIFTVLICNAQAVQPTYEKTADIVKATYYFEDGSIKEQGFFKDAKLTGRWVSYNKQGEKTMMAHYKAGKKVGKWFTWNNNSLKEINYKKNVIASIKNWQGKSGLASRKE
jgi:antitoxin component YwqK of YwqJK toxin-antitoxin module